MVETELCGVWFLQRPRGVRTKDKLDGARTQGDDQRWRLCGNSSVAAPWAGVDYDGFLDKTQVAEWVVMVYMAKGLL